MSKKYGKIKEISLRKEWEKETDFSKWLSKPKNLNYLGKSIGKNLGDIQTEKPIGSYKVDLFAIDQSNGSEVIIENQLEKTDHKHLGQVLTYAIKSSARTAVWLFNEITLEHRQVIDWLNQHGSGIEFFGVQVEKFQIGQSNTLPRFKVTCHPSNWSSKKTKNKFFFNKLIKEFGNNFYIKHNANNCIHITPSKEFSWFTAFRATDRPRIGIWWNVRDKTKKQDMKLLNLLKKDVRNGFLKGFEIWDKERIGICKEFKDIYDSETYPAQQRFFKKNIALLYRSINKNILKLEKKLPKAS